MSPKQKKLAAKAPPPNKLDEKDFKVLREEKAKGRGMGLQDESVQPGKVQKAFLGKMIKGAGKSIGRLFGKKQSAIATPNTARMSGSGKGMGGMLPKLLQKAIDDGIIKPASKGRMMKARVGKSIKKDPTKTVNPFEKKSSKFMERRKKLAGVKSLAGKAGRLGAAATILGIAGAGAAKLGQTIGRKMSEKKDKKMGGGMIAPSQRPGYSKGTMIKARGCKLGRTRPTKIT